MTDHSRKIYIERIKNVLIVVLFLTTILLLSFFWKDISLKDLNPINIIEQNNNAYVPEAQELIKPKNILFYYGSEDYTVAKGNDAYGETTVYSHALDLIQKYMTNASSAEKIEADQYNQVMSYAFVNIRFDYNIPFEQFLKQNDIAASVSLNDIPEMTSIGLSSASSENLFVKDKETDSYYRIIIEDQDTVDELSEQVMDFIQTMEKSEYVPYYNMANIAGGENDALMPLYMPSSITAVEGTREFSISDQARVNRIASGFFASGLDFVRKITENKGSLLYMCGSSQFLLMNEDGSIEYSENFESSGYKEQNFYDSLSTAIEYVSSHGGWTNLYQNGCRAYLKSVEKVELSGYKGYEFFFGLEYEGVPVEYTSGNILSVKVCGTQVVTYERNIILTSRDSGQEDEGWYAMAPIDILTNNYSKIGDGGFEQVISNIKSIKFCCIRDRENDSLTVKPAWLIIMSDDGRFWFDPQTGEMLGHADAEVS